LISIIPDIEIDTKKDFTLTLTKNQLKTFGDRCPLGFEKLDIFTSED
jgi:hypothetical protein